MSFGCVWLCFGASGFDGWCGIDSVWVIAGLDVGFVMMWLLLFGDLVGGWGLRIGFGV